MKTYTIKSALIEIFVVSVGILLAFSLENYRQTSIDDDTKERYLVQLQSEILINIDELDSAYTDLQIKLKKLSEGQIALKAKDYTSKSLIESSVIMFTKPFINPNIQTYKAIVNSNGLSLFSDLKFKTMLTSLYTDYENLVMLDKIFEKYSADYFVDYNRNHYNYLTNRPIDNKYFSRIEFSNSLVSYYILAKQIVEYYKKLKTKNKELLNYITLIR